MRPENKVKEIAIKVTEIRPALKALKVIIYKVFFLLGNNLDLLVDNSTREPVYRKMNPIALFAFHLEI